MKFEDVVMNCLNVNMLSEAMNYMTDANADNKTKELIEYKTRILTKGPTNDEKNLAEIHRMKANEFIRKKDIQGAMREFQESIMNNPINPITYSERSLIYLTNKNYKEALVDAHKSIQISIKFFKGYRRLADIYTETLEYEKAIIAITALLKIEPNNVRGKCSLIKIKEMANKNGIKINNDEFIAGKAKDLLAGKFNNEVQQQTNLLFSKIQKGKCTDYIYQLSWPIINPEQVQIKSSPKHNNKPKRKLSISIKELEKDIVKDHDKMFHTSKFGLLANEKIKSKCSITKANAVKRMTKFQEKKEYINDDEAVKTSILDNYKKFCPELRKINHNNDKVHVYKVILNDGRMFILKIVTISKDRPGHIYTLLLEFYIGRTFSLICDKCVKTLNMKEIEVGENKNSMRIELLSEYGGQSARQLAEQKNIKDPVRIAFQLIEILVEMEEYGIAHLDIKPHNIVLNESSQQLKIIDFGTSMAFYLNRDAVNETLKDDYKLISGFTRIYAPPELIRSSNPDIGKNIIPHEVDVFCFGMTFAELLLYKDGKEIKGGSPIDAKEFDGFIGNLKHTLLDLKEDIWIDLIIKCLTYDQFKRPKAREIKILFNNILANQSCIYTFPTKKKHGIFKCIKTAMTLNEWEVTILYCRKFMEELTNEKPQRKNFNNKLMFIYRSIAKAYYEIYFYQNSKKYLDKSLKINSETRTPNNVQVIVDYLATGLCIMYESNHIEAINYFKKAVLIINQIYSGCSSYQLKVYQLIALAYGRNNKKENAIEYCLKMDKVLRKGCFYTNNVFLNWKANIIKGEIYRNIGEYSKAINFLEKSIELAHLLPGKELWQLATSIFFSCQFVRFYKRT